MPPPWGLLVSGYAVNRAIVDRPVNYKQASATVNPPSCRKLPSRPISHFAHPAECLDRGVRIAAAQISPVFLDADATTARMVTWIERAADKNVELIAFGETFLPGYPAWVSSTDGARFEDPTQKAAYARYLAAAVEIDGPHLRAIEEASRRTGVFVIAGVAERERGTVFASAVPFDPQRGRLPQHRKLRPTHEERMVWGPGDGYGLRAFEFRGHTITVLNCWENWMPLARFAAYAQGTTLHVGLWPGSSKLTADITRFVAREGRCFMLSASGLLQASDLPGDFELGQQMPGGWLQDGGSCIAGPDGNWISAPVAQTEGLVVAEVDAAAVGAERQNFDPAGHYHRPDVFDLTIHRRRAEPVRFDDA